jgi:hypothetical protein
VRTCPNCGARLDPMRGVNLDDFLVLLALCRDAIDQDQAPLARGVLTLMLDQRGAVGLKSRNLARRLAEQMAEREQPPQ